MDKIEFFFDPICPWAWVTSRWIDDLANQQVVEPTWRFISLAVVNSSRDYEAEFPQGYTNIHGLGHNLLRVAAAVRQDSGNDGVARWYREIGTELHTNKNRERYIAGESIAPILKRAGLDQELEGAFSDSTYDALITAETNTALERTGRDVGTPIITFGENGPSLFGPVMSTIPKGQDAIEVYGAYKVLASREDFYEMKRAVRKAPVFE